MKKIFLQYNTIRNDAIKLAKKIHEDNFIPDVIYVPLRGGAYMGNVISEYFKIVRKGQRPVFYAAVVARSYNDIRDHERVMIDGWTYNPEHLRHGDKILLVDDIFDSGRTINHLVKIFMDKGVPLNDIKIAVHDYKIYKYKGDNHIVVPDFYSKKHVIDKEKNDIWIHYLSHELQGLEDSEIEENYKDDPEIVEILKKIRA